MKKIVLLFVYLMFCFCIVSKITKILKKISYKITAILCYSQILRYIDSLEKPHRKLYNDTGKLKKIVTKISAVVPFQKNCLYIKDI